MKSLLEHTEEILEKEIRELYSFAEAYEEEEEKGGVVDSVVWDEYKKIEQDILLPDEIRRAAIVGLAWKLQNSTKWVVQGLVKDTYKGLKVSYNTFVDYLKRKFVPISMNYPKATTWIWNGQQYVENNGQIEGVIEETLKPYFDDKQIKRHEAEILYRLQLETLFWEMPFNQRTDLLPVKNGALLLDQTYKLLPHSPAFGFTYCIQAEYNPDARCERIEKFIKDVVREEDVNVLYEIPALCLLDERYHYAYMLYGDGSNGKSTYLNLLRTFLGEKNVASVSFQELCEGRFAVAELFGKLANIYADIPAKPVSYAGVFKMLTGGDLIKAEKKYKNPFYFVNRAKLIFSCNEYPETRDMTSAFWRRWIIIEFPNKFQRNENLIKELTDEEELSGFLNKVLEARTRILIKGVTITKTMEDVKNEWMTRANSVWGFVNNCLVEDPKGEITKEDMYEAYKTFCEERDLKVVSRTKFALDLQKYIRVRSSMKRMGGSVKRIWEGVRLICQDKSNDESGYHEETWDLSNLLEEEEQE